MPAGYMLGFATHFQLNLTYFVLYYYVQQGDCMSNKQNCHE